jgi:xanthine dehydrogenase accessory factor
LWLERFTNADSPLLQTLCAPAASAVRAAAVLASTIVGSAVERRLVGTPLPGTPAELLLHTPRAQAAPRLVHSAAGEVTLLERVDQEFPPVWLYGAGHVGQALARILVELPVALTWIDAREALIPAELCDAWSRAAGADPVASVAAAPAGTRFVVLTHSHALDYALCRAILARGDFSWAGLIGSASKAARFRSRLARDQFSEVAIARLVCPIGIDGIASKWPAAIAVGVAAQLLRDLSMSAEMLEDAGQPGRERAAAIVSTRCAERDCAGCGS